MADRRGANHAMARLVTSHAMSVIAEWAGVIGILVFVFDRAGTRATGVASMLLLVATLVIAPIAGAVVDRLAPQRARLLGLSVQTIGYAFAALAIQLELPTAVPIAATMLGLGATTTLRPTSAMLIPAVARSSTELVLANVWVWYAEAASVLGGPLLATALLAVHGPAAVLAGCAAAALVGVAATFADRRTGPPAAGRRAINRAPGAATPAATDAAPMHGLRAAWRTLRVRPGLASVLGVVWMQYIMIGALDLVLVVIARDELDLGESGPGLLSTALGAGAVLAVVAARPLLRRTRLAPVLSLALTIGVVAFAVFGVAMSVPVALVALSLAGVGRSLLDGTSRMLLQRSAGPDDLRAVFTVREVCANSGLLIGSAVALTCLEIGDGSLALVTLAALFLVALALTARGLRVADDAADVPVVEMALLRSLAMFAPLPAVALEAVARAATTVAIAADSVVIAQGDSGDTFYAVLDGSFDVRMSGRHIRTAERSDCFGEIALLADVPRTATVSATRAGTLLAIDRVAFLVAVTGTDSSRQAAWGVVASRALDTPVTPGASFVDEA